MTEEEEEEEEEDFVRNHKTREEVPNKVKKTDSCGTTLLT